MYRVSVNVAKLLHVFFQVTERGRTLDLSIMTVAKQLEIVACHHTEFETHGDGASLGTLYVMHVAWKC